MVRSARAPRRSSSRAPAGRPMRASCECRQRSSMRSSRPVARRGSGLRCMPSATGPPRPSSTPSSARRSAGRPLLRIASSTRSSFVEQEVDRFARLGVTASIQPIHAAADRDLVEACWDGRQDRAYAWRSLRSAGAHLAAGSDAPVESVNPWLGMFAAVHRRLPADPRGDWRSAQALTIVEALSAYTLGPARALGAHDEGHLRPGARADLAVLSVDLDDPPRGR